MADSRIVLARKAELHHGVFTRNEAFAAGISRHELDASLETGRYERIYETVYVHSGAPKTLELFEIAACKWAGPHAALSHRSALFEHKLIEWRPDQIEVTTTGRRCHNAPAVVHRTTYLPAHHIVFLRGRPVTDVARTLFDAGAVVPQRVVTRAVETAIRQSRTTRSELIGRLIEHGGRGRRGCGKLRFALEELDPALAGTESDLEALMLRNVWNGRLARPEVQYEVICKGRRRRLDFAYPHIRLNIEGDGFDEHGRRLSFDADRERDRELTASGWQVIRVTWHQVKDEPERVIEDIQQAYEHRMSLFFGSSDRYNPPGDQRTRRGLGED